MTILGALALVLLGFGLGILADDWATRGLDRAVAEAKRDAKTWTGGVDWAKGPDRTVYGEDLEAYGVGTAELDPAAGETWSALARQFPSLTVGQLDNLIERRAQERRHA